MRLQLLANQSKPYSVGRTPQTPPFGSTAQWAELIGSAAVQLRLKRFVPICSVVELRVARSCHSHLNQHEHDKRTQKRPKQVSTRSSYNSTSWKSLHLNQKGNLGHLQLFRGESQSHLSQRQDRDKISEMFKRSVFHTFHMSEV